jgi:putative ABC transport system substrate-binding protein
MVTIARRKLLAALTGAAVWPVAARSQQSAEMPVIGWLESGSRQTVADYSPAFHQGLAEMGYVEGRNVAIEYRFANSQYDRLPLLVAELVRRRVAVIYAINTANAVRRPSRQPRRYRSYSRMAATRSSLVSPPASTTPAATSLA